MTPFALPIEAGRYQTKDHAYRLVVTDKWTTDAEKKPVTEVVLEFLHRDAMEQPTWKPSSLHSVEAAILLTLLGKSEITPEMQLAIQTWNNRRTPK